MELGLIVAVAENDVIGKDGKLPWNIPEDLRRFKELTTGHPVIMGRNTYNSIIERNGRPLPNRLNIVLSQNQKVTGDGIVNYSDLDTALKNLRDPILVEGIDFSKAYIIGGSRVYKEAIPIVDFMEITRVWDHYEGDAFFPKFNEREWKEVYYNNSFEGFSFVSFKNRKRK